MNLDDSPADEAPPPRRVLLLSMCVPVMKHQSGHYGRRPHHRSLRIHHAGVPWRSDLLSMSRVKLVNASSGDSRGEQKPSGPNQEESDGTNERGLMELMTHQDAAAEEAEI
ncbi:unnamed protein product [Pleuronectes platessa]|uniref:Uncharacterized protein n=1 Tax=Pleuronectes platessa TaxID=8262 RepID=A0A9N7TZS5_PLEPL|nr:unnamed protein product [Pleuronectes platessa]